MKKPIIVLCILIGIITVLAGCANTHKKPHYSRTATVTSEPTYTSSTGAARSATVTSPQ